MKSIHNFVEGDTGSALRVTCLDDQTGLPISLASHTVYIRFKVDSGTLASQTMTILSAASGTTQYRFQTGELTPGTLFVSVQIVDNDDTTVISQLDPFSYKVRARFA